MTCSFPCTHNARTCHHIALLSSGRKTHSSLSHHHAPLTAQHGHVLGSDETNMCPPGCHGPVARLKHRVTAAAKPTSWPEPPLAGEDIRSDDKDGQLCWTGQDQFYRAWLPMGSQLSPGRMQLLRPRARTTPPQSSSHPTSPTACHPGV